MLKNILKIAVIAISSWLSAACDEAVEREPGKAVIEGTFSSDGYPVVIFSRSVSPDYDGSIAEAVINWGKVTVSDGEHEVILTGRVDNSYLPPFCYYSHDIKGIPGKTYTVTARFNELYAESTVRMPYPTPIDSISIVKTDVDTLRAATLHFTSPPDTPAYFYLTLQRNERGAHPEPCLLGTVEAANANTPYSIAILRPRIKLPKQIVSSDDTGDYISSLIVGEEWIVALNRVEKGVYEFWKSYDNMLLFSSSPFIATDESLSTNITGGYGVWSPQGSASLEFTVK